MSYPQRPVDSRLPDSRADGCPECVTNVEAPKATVPATDGFIASYLCSDCGHAWITSWMED